MMYMLKFNSSKKLMYNKIKYHLYFMLKMAIKKINIKIFNNKIKIYPIHK